MHEWTSEINLKIEFCIKLVTLINYITRLISYISKNNFKNTNCTHRNRKLYNKLLM